MINSVTNLLVSSKGTIVDAMKAINDGGWGIAFVSERRRRVLGIVTDGDLRRALLAGASLESRILPDIMRRDFTFVRPATSRGEVLDLMRSLGISQVPVVDTEGRLAGLHTLAELAGRQKRPNWALLMAGGRGERLRPLTTQTPKPMLTVAGRPILERLVLHLVGHGIRHIYVAVNHLAEVIESHFGTGAQFGCQLSYLRETKPLGTGGALSLLPARPKHALLVMNGDLVTQCDIGGVLDSHERGKCVATVGLRPYTVKVPFGVAKTRGRRLIRLEEKPSVHMLINAGIYVLSPSVLRLVPRDSAFPITELFERCQAKGLPVGAHVIKDEWADIGRPDELQRARGER